MTPKEQEFRKAILSVLRSPNTLRSLTIADDIIAKARDCYAEELQSERMVTFKLSQQIERKDAALKSVLSAFDSQDLQLWETARKQVKEALE